MKLTPKKKDALSCLLWAVLTIANGIAMLATEENVYGFLMLFSLIWFLNEDREYKQKYPEKKKTINKNNKDYGSEIDRKGI